MVAMAVGSHTIYCLFKALVRFSMLACCAGGRLGRADGILAAVPAQSPLGCNLQMASAKGGMVIQCALLALAFKLIAGQVVTLFATCGNS